MGGKSVQSSGQGKYLFLLTHTNLYLPLCLSPTKPKTQIPQTRYTPSPSPITPTDTVSLRRRSRRTLPWPVTSSGRVPSCDKPRVKTLIRHLPCSLCNFLPGLTRTNVLNVQNRYHNTNVQSPIRLGTPRTVVTQVETEQKASHTLFRRQPRRISGEG